MNKSACILLSVFIILLACKKEKKEATVTPKEQAADTLKPSPYLPAFPGSYWKYVHNYDSITYTTSATYQKDSYQDYDEDGKMIKSGTAFVPFYNNIPIWQTYAHRGPLKDYQIVLASSLVPIVPDTFSIGRIWCSDVGSHYVAQARIVKKDTSIEVLGKSFSPTIVIYHTWSYSIIQLPDYREYYTKGVGLVKKEFLNSTDGSIESEMLLVSYHVNN